MWLGERERKTGGGSKYKVVIYSHYKKPMVSPVLVICNSATGTRISSEAGRKEQLSKFSKKMRISS